MSGGERTPASSPTVPHGQPPRQVALSFPLRLGPWQDIVQGVLRYARSVGNWRTSLHTQEDVRGVLAGRPDGVISLIRTRDAATVLTNWGGPVVDTGHELGGLAFARVGIDDRRIGEAAAIHLMELPAASFAFVGNVETPVGRLALEGFRDSLSQQGKACQVAPAGTFDLDGMEPPAAGGEAVAWIASLPRPAAVFALHDAVARHIAEACQFAHLRVPVDVAILGNLDDQFLCHSTNPPLSSIRLPGEQLGYEAARVLEAMMAGGSVPAKRIELPPLGVVARRSTEGPVADSDLGAALNFIRERFADPISVHHVVRASGLSRSTLERRFRAELGRAPLAELTRVRVKEAIRLLAESDLSNGQIARAVGLTDARRLASAVRELTGSGPSSFRRK